MAGQTVVVSVLADTKKFASGMGNAAKDTDGLTGALKGFGVAAGVAFAAAGAAALAFGAASIKAAAESEAISKGMENAAKNAGVFGQSAADIGKATAALDDHSTKLAELTGIDDELFNSMKTGWLATPSLAALGTEGINNLATVAADVAKGTGKDIGAIGLAFQKVAGDSETALSKLSKQGIILEDSQKGVYEAMVAAGDEAGAQAYLIETLGEKYKGAAEAAANPFDRLKVIFENLMETVGKALLPAIETLVPIIADFITNLTASPEFQVFLEELAKTFQELLTALLPLLPPIMDLILALLPPLMDLIKGLAPVVVMLIEAFMPLIMAVIEPLVPLLLRLVEAFVPLLDKILPPLMGLIDALVPIIFQLLDAFMPLIESLLPPLIDLFLLLIDPLLELLDVILPFLPPLIDGIAKAFQWLTDNILKPLIDSVSSVVGWFQELFGFDGKSVNVKTSAPGPGSIADRGTGALRPFATGGIVRRPTAALIGEAGPEAVIPLAKLEKIMAQSSGTTVVVQGNVGWDPEALARKVAQKQRQAYAMAGLNGMIGVA